jgi:predicted nucleic acid-binding protein
LAKPYFLARVQAEEAQRIMDAYELVATSLPDPIDPPRVVRDANDDYLVALAKAAEATAIVSGDHDLIHHPDLQPEAIDARAACEMLSLLDAS